MLVNLESRAATIPDNADRRAKLAELDVTRRNASSTKHSGPSLASLVVANAECPSIQSLVRGVVLQAL